MNPINILRKPIDKNALVEYKDKPFESMIKYIVDIEYTSLINIRPGLGNRSMEIQSEEIREKVKKITFDWIIVQ